MNEKIAFIIFAVLVANALLPVAVYLLEMVLEFWSRGTFYKGLTVSLQKKKWGRIWETGMKFNTDDAIFSWVAVDFGVGLLLGTCLIPLTAKWGLTPLFITGAIAAFVILPRYLYDVKTALQYNSKSRESERIAELEKRVERLSK